MKSYQKLLGLTAGAALTGYLVCPPSEEEEKMTEDLTAVIYREENIPLLEGIIKDEAALYRQLQSLVEHFEENDDEDAIALFDTSIKPRLEEFLETDAFENPTITRTFWEYLFSPTILFCASMPLGLGFLRIYQRSKKVGSSLAVSAFVSLVCWLPATLCTFLLFKAVEQACYNPLMNEILLLSSGTSSSRAITLSHEITHYLQDSSDYDHPSLVGEGHARGVELELGRVMYQETGDPTYLLDHVKDELGDLLTVYDDLCKHFGVEYCQLATNIEADLEVEAHGLGTTLFMIREHHWGDRRNEIYPRVLRGDYCLLLHGPEEDDCRE